MVTFGGVGIMIFYLDSKNLIRTQIGFGNSE